MGAIIVEPRVAIDTAPWIRRVLASLVDDAILGAVTFLAVPTVGAVGPSLAPMPWPRPADTAGWTSSVWVVGAFVAVLLLQAYTGSSPGKLLLGIAVLRDGRPIGIVRTVLRLLCHVLDGVLMIGYLRPMWNAERQTFADSIVGTHVVHAPRIGWRRPATWAAGGVAALSLAMTGVVSGTSTGVSGSCLTMQVMDPTAAVTDVWADYVPATTLERRLWVTRERPDPDGGHLTISWTRLGADTDVRVLVTHDDGTTTTRVHDAGSTPAAGGGSLTVPAAAAPASWTVESVLDGTVTARCTGAPPSR